MGFIHFLDHLNYHHWLIAAFIMLTVEVLIGSAFFLWLSFAAIAVGIAILLGPLLGLHVHWQAQLLLFALGASLSVYAWRRYKAAKQAGSDNAE